MLRQSTREARLTVAASFPPHFFLENLALRDDNSMLVTAVMRKELYYVPHPSADREVKPVLLHTFNELAWGLLNWSATCLRSSRETTIQRTRRIFTSWICADGCRVSRLNPS